jgi:hypothetical protein
MNIHVFWFAELADASSAAKLANLPYANKIQGLPSGPNIQRTLRRKLREIYAPNESSDSRENLDPSKMTPMEIAQEILHTKGRKIKSSDEESIEMGNYKISVKKERRRLKDIRAEEASAKINSEDKKALMALADERARGESSMMFLPSKGEEDPESRSSRAFSAAGTEPGSGPDVVYGNYSTGSRGVAKVAAPETENDPLSIVQEGKREGGAFHARQEGPGQGEEYSVRQEGLIGKEYSA